MTLIPIRLTLRAKDLPNDGGGLFGVIDPYAVVYFKAVGDDDVEELGRTEVIKNNVSPTWISSFSFDFNLGKPASILVKIYDENSSDEDEYICGTVVTVGSVLGKRGNILGKKMKGGGTLIVHMEKEETEGKMLLQLRGKDLKNVEDGLFAKSDPFFEIAKQELETDEWITVYRSEYVKSNLKPLWNSCKIEMDRLCMNDIHSSLRISVFDHEGSGDHKLIGSLVTTVSEIIAVKKFGGGGDSESTNMLDLLDDDNEFVGGISIMQARIVGKSNLKPKLELHDEEEDNVEENDSDEEELIEKEDDVIEPVEPSFMDYLNSGCELSLCIAIDFTGSNGDPRTPSSLHYISPDGSFNDYQSAIYKIGNILSDFDSDKQFPVWGFGAKLDGEVRHAFALSAGQVNGIDGVLETYQAAFTTGFIMSRPTDITQILKVASNRAKRVQEGNEGFTYSVLLIITDGAVSDIDATVTALEEIEDAPLSVIIVGVGNEDFSDMQFLEDNSKVTFVPFVGHEENLAEDTLEKLPDQLVNYYIAKGIQPPSVVEPDDDEINVLDYNEEEEIEL